MNLDLVLFFVICMAAGTSIGYIAGHSGGWNKGYKVGYHDGSFDERHSRSREG